MAEARFLRGYYYFQLEQFFGHIPLILKSLTPADYKQLQADPADVYNQIASDLYYAYNNLPSVISSDEAGRVSKWAAGSMDMEAHIYTAELPKLLKEGKITEAQIDDAVRRILRMKFKLGLFDDPYRYCDTIREKEQVLSQGHLDIARDAVRKSIVLLKNNGVLPLSKNVKSIGVIGPLADDQLDMMGTWSAMGDAKDVVTLLSALKVKLPKATITYAKGCEIDGDSKADFSQALAVARRSDVVVVVVGEAAMMSGEALSRAYLDLPGVQKDLVLALNALHKPMTFEPNAVVEVFLAKPW